MAESLVEPLGDTTADRLRGITGHDAVAELLPSNSSRFRAASCPAWIAPLIIASSAARRITSLPTDRTAAEA
ncbi:hypothetical protein [Nocardia testacea]|uniref:hypothetical protein n=1 Tax=Nocardia testacea TaxID=248551 RepID=UPI0002F935F4|nr:hypothetical protein [Nocardia testacea]